MLTSLLQFAQKPWYQAAGCLALSLLLAMLFRPKQLDSLWVIAALGYLLFLLSNAVGQWFADGSWSYFGYSLLCSLAYLFLANLLVTTCASLFNSEGAGESSMIFLVIMFHPPLLLLAMFTKYIYLKWL